MSNKEVPIVSTWMGKPINEGMSKQELIKIINYLAKENLRKSDEMKTRVKMFQLFRKVGAK
jgi:hypothetical protein